MRAWLKCAVAADSSRVAGGSAHDDASPALQTRCSEGFLALALERRSRGWTEGRTRLGSVTVDVHAVGLSPYLQRPLNLALARDVSMSAYGGERFASAGFGVPLAVTSARCKEGEDETICNLMPPEGVFRNGTAWIEAGEDAIPRLVIADPLKVRAAPLGTGVHPLSLDTSASYAKGIQSSRLDRLGVWGLLGGREVGRRAGVYLLEDYDPAKQPVVMIHGLGSNPLIWARLSNAIWGSAELRSHYQVWHVVYQTNAPLLVVRRHIEDYLDQAWRILDPEADDPARLRMVIVGHSLGGVAGRMLCVDTHDVLWDAAFLKPADQLRADPDDLAQIQRIFRFRPYPGVARAIFLASPHKGSPTASRWFGRLARVIVGGRTPEIQALRRIALANPDAIRPELRRIYERGAVNSISTLQHAQQVRLASEKLMPGPPIIYHSIAGFRSGEEQTDGVVPVDSARLDQAASTLLVPSGHDVYDSPEAVAEVLRILREEMAIAGQEQDAPVAVPE